MLMASIPIVCCSWQVYYVLFTTSCQHNRTRATPSLHLLQQTVYYHKNIFPTSRLDNSDFITLDWVECLHRVDLIKSLLVGQPLVCRSPLEIIPYKFVFTSTSVLSISCSSWMLCEMGSKWLYSSWLVKCYCQDSCKTLHNILM